MYWRPGVRHVGFIRESTNIERITRSAVQVRLQTSLIHVRHQRKLQLGERTSHIHSGLARRIHHTVLLILLIEQPRHAIHRRAMHTGMRAKQTKRNQRLYTAGSGYAPSKPPISWLQKPKPELVIDKPARSD